MVRRAGTRMKLNKHYFLILVVVCAMFICSLLVFYLQNTSALKKVLAEQNQQDFTLTLQDEADITELSKKYSFMYDLLAYKVIYDDKNIFRLMKDTRSIDIPMYSEGAAPKTINEIAIDKNFSQDNQLTLGSALTIGNRTYVISGIFTLPDAIMPMVADNGLAYQAKTQAFILCDEAMYSIWEELEKVSYSGRFMEELSEEQQQNALAEMRLNPNIKSIVSKEENPHILAALNTKEKMFKICLLSAVCILVFTVIILLTTTIIQNINETKSDMGILKALGYTTTQIAKKYLIIGVFVLVGGVIGYGMSSIISPLFINRINAAFLVPDIPQNFNGLQFILFIIMPALCFSILAFGLAVFTLRKPPLEMIYKTETIKVNIFVKKRQKRRKTKPFRKTVFRSIITNNILLVFLAMLTGFMVSANLQIAFSLQAMADKVSSITLKGIEYESNVRYQEAKEMESLNADTPYFVRDCKMEFPNGEVLNNGQFMALYNSMSLFKLYSIQKQHNIDISQQKGIVVNDWMRKKYDLAIGDTIKIYINNDIYPLPITAIEQSVYGETVYGDGAMAIQAGILDRAVYNGVFTADNVEFDNKQHVFVSKFEDIVKSSSQQKGTYIALSFLFIIIGLALSILTIGIVVKVIITANRKYLALMKAFGYTNSECNRIVLSGFRIIAYIGFVIGTFYAIALSHFLFGTLAKSSTIAIPMTPDSKAIMLSLIIFAISYELIMLLYKKSINAVSLQEVMMK